MRASVVSEKRFRSHFLPLILNGVSASDIAMSVGVKPATVMQYMYDFRDLVPNHYFKQPPKGEKATPLSIKPKWERVAEEYANQHRFASDCDLHVAFDPATAKFQIENAEIDPEEMKRMRNWINTWFSS